MNFSPNEGSNIEQSRFAEAEAKIRALAGAYVQQAGDDINQCIAEARHLRANRSRNAEDLRPLYSILHNVKGMGGMFDYHLITSIAAIACNILRERDAVSDEALIILEKCILTMQTVLQRQITGTGGETGKKLVEKLFLLATPYLRDDDYCE